MRIIKRRCMLRGVIASVLCATWGSASALNLMKSETSELNLDIEAIFGIFHSEERYNQLHSTPGSASWQEGYIKYGLSGSTSVGSGTLFGAAIWSPRVPSVTAMLPGLPLVMKPRRILRICTSAGVAKCLNSRSAVRISPWATVF